MTLLICACSKIGGVAPQIDAAGFGGEGKLETARHTLLGAVQRYNQSGVPVTFGRDYGPLCRSLHTSYVCDLMKDAGDDTDHIDAAAAFVSDNLGEIVDKLTNAPFLMKTPEQVVAPDQKGKSQQVDAMVPKGANEAWFSTKFLETATDERIAAAALHEVLHMLDRHGKGRLGDWDTLEGVGTVMTAFNYIGGSVVADPFATASPYRDAVLADKPVMYFPFEDDAGSKLAWNWASRGMHAELKGNITLGQAGAISTSGSSMLISATGNTPGSVALTVPQLASGSTVTWESWVNWAGDTATTPFAFGTFRLMFEWDMYGFNTNCGDIFGIEARGSGGSYSGSFGGHWVHLAAKFVDGNISASTLYVNGVLQTQYQRYNTACFNWASIATAASMNGSGNFDELAIYDYDVPEANIQQHYAAASFTTQTGSVTVNLSSGGMRSTVTQVSIDKPCAVPIILTSSRITSMTCGTQAGAAQCTSAPPTDGRPTSKTMTTVRSEATGLVNGTFGLSVRTGEPVWVGSASRDFIVDYQVVCQ